MLLISYVLTASLELALIIQSYKTIGGSFAWSFGFLFFISIVAIPVETSKTGKLIRKEFKGMGVNTYLFDFISNFLKTIAYILVFAKVLSHITGLLIAYSVTLLFTVIVTRKYTKSSKKD